MGTSEVAAHDEDLLAEHYTWMLGDFDALVAEQRRLLEAIGIDTSATRESVALDLGCGSGLVRPQHSP